jgi:prefoldin subunit 5
MKCAEKANLDQYQDWEAEIAALDQKIASIKSRIKRLKRLKKKLEAGK